jgi:small conductance mechanosensitive channel
MRAIGLTGIVPDEAAEGLWNNLKDITATKMFSAVVVAAACLLAVKVLVGVLDRALRRSSMDSALKKLLRGLLKGGLLFVSVIVVLGRLGIEVTSLVAVLSVIGLAFSLALQNFLSNVAGGMQLLASHPFKPGDFVEAGGCSGTVTDIGMFYTRLTTYDNKLVQIPNSSIVSANIINYSTQPSRRVDLTVSASYDAPVDQVLAALAKLGEEHPLVLDDPAPAAHVTKYGDSAIEYALRVWCANADYWTVYNDLMDSLQPAFAKAGVEMTYPHMNVHMMENK